jgi:chemotaxis signal transduction protein
MTPELRFDRLLDFFGKKKEKKKETKDKKAKEKKKQKKDVKKEPEIKEKEIKRQKVKVEKIVEGIPEKEKDREKEFLIFKMGNEFYSLPLRKVKEIYSTLEVIKAPELPEYISGFAKFKKNIVPVIDISRVLDISPSEEKNYVVVEVGKTPLFLLIGEIKGIVKETEENTFDVPFNLDRDLFQKIIYENDILIGCINPDYFSRIKKEIVERVKEKAK